MFFCHLYSNKKEDLNRRRKPARKEAKLKKDLEETIIQWKILQEEGLDMSFFRKQRNERIGGAQEVVSARME